MKLDEEIEILKRFQDYYKGSDLDQAIDTLIAACQRHKENVKLLSNLLDDISDALGVEDKYKGEPDHLFEQIELLKQSKNGAYSERNHLVAALARLYPSYIARTNIKGWDNEWHSCVYINLPSGQISYHYHDSDHYLFEHLPPFIGEWDGHDKGLVHDRLRCLAPITITDEMVERAARGIAFIGGMVGDLDEETGNHLMIEIDNDNCHQMAKAALTAALHGGGDDSFR